MEAMLAEQKSQLNQEFVLKFILRMEKIAGPTIIASPD